jgi:putative hydrolase of the HAD superfamily
MIKAVVFDLDETLYDEFDFVRGGFKAVAKYVKMEFGLDDKKTYSLLIKSFKKYGRGRTFDHVFGNREFFNPDAVKKMVEVYRSHDVKLKPYEETIPLLKKLKKKYLIGIITDEQRELQEGKIKALGIKDFFDLIVFTDDLKAEKPKKDSFEYLLKRLNLKGHEVVYVGDNPEKDFAGARALNIKTVRLMKGYFKNIAVTKKLDADFKIKSLEKLPEVLARIDGDL